TARMAPRTSPSSPPATSWRPRGRPRAPQLPAGAPRGCASRRGWTTWPRGCRATASRSWT
ncbi:unnamed protein product, partial [Prorocentrum cordatum]